MATLTRWTYLQGLFALHETMSASTYRNTVARLRREKASLEQRLNQENRNLSRITTARNQILQSINRTSNMSLSTLNSKLRQIESKDKEYNRVHKKAADLENQIARKAQEIAQNMQRLDQAEQQEQRQKDAQEKRRRDEELRHARSVTQEINRRRISPRRFQRSPLPSLPRLTSPQKEEIDIPLAKIGREGFRLLVLAYTFDKANWNSVRQACKAAADLIYFIDPEDHIKPDSLQRKTLGKLRQGQESGLRVYLKVHDYKARLKKEIEAQKLDAYLPIIDKYWQRWETAGKPTAETLPKVDRVDE